MHQDERPARRDRARTAAMLVGAVVLIAAAVLQAAALDRGPAAFQTAAPDHGAAAFQTAAPPGAAPFTEAGPPRGDDSPPPHLAPSPQAAVAVVKVHHGRAIVVPILTYHYIRVNPVASDKLGFNLSVTPANFAAQMNYLAQLGGHTITPAQLVAALDNGGPLPPHPVMLTFDDGHDDFATQAAPILASHGFVGVTYVVTGFLGHTSYMTVAQVQQVAAMGMVVGDHTVSHMALGAGGTSQVVWNQIVVAQQQLAHIVGHPIKDFAYPFGSYSPDTEALVARAGFADAVTTENGDTQYQDAPFALSRVEVTGYDNVATFAAKTLLAWQGHPYRAPANPSPHPPTPAPSPSPQPPTPPAKQA